MKKATFIILSLLLVATTSCKKHLSKKNAFSLITAMERYPRVKEYSFTKGFIKDENTVGNGATAIIGEEEFKEEEKMINFFRDKKMVVFEEIPQREETTNWVLGTTIRTWTDVKISLSEEGKKYLIREDDKSLTVKLWETNIESINYVDETNNGRNATVEYTIANTNITPFGEGFPDKDQTIQRQEFFYLQKGKWRIRE